MIRKNITIFLFLFVLLLFSSCASLWWKPFDTFEKNINDNYSIRVTAYEVNCAVLCDADYYIESVNEKTNLRKEIYIHKGDDPYKIPKENFVVKNENFAYFWWRWIFGVTTDGGKTWKVFNNSEDEEIKNSTGYGQIEKVEINTDGVGKMHFKQFQGEKNKIDYLETRDFGKIWINFKPTEPKPPKNIFNK